MRETGKVRARITEDVALARMRPITTPIFVQGRNGDELQGIFRVCYDLLVELGKDAKWATYEHAGARLRLCAPECKGVYTPDAVQIQAVNDSLAFFNAYWVPGAETLEFAAEPTIERIRPAAAQRDGEAHQAPQQRVFVAASGPGKAGLPIDDGDDQQFDRRRGGEEAGK